MRFHHVVAALLAAAALVPAVQADWGSFHGDNTNSGFVQSSTYAVYKDLWWNVKLNPDTQVDSSPAVDSQASIVIVTTWDKKVHAFDEESGAELWNQTMTAQISGTPLIDNGRVFVVDTAGVLNSYNVQKGSLLGSVNIGGSTLASPAVHDSSIFIGNDNGDMKAYEEDHLKLLWSFNDGIPMGTVAYSGTPPVPSCLAGTAIPRGAIRGAPAVYNKKVYFASVNQYVYAIDELGNSDATTTPEWVFRTKANVFASPLVTHGKVYIGSLDESFYALAADPAGQGPIKAGSNVCGTFEQTTPIWNYCVPPAATGGSDSKVWSTAAVDGPEGGTISHVIFGSNNGDVTALDPVTGGGTSGYIDCSNTSHPAQTPMWASHTGSAIKSSPAIANGHVVVGSDNGHVYWMKVSNGTIERDFKPTGTAPIKSNPAIDGQRAFVTSFEGDIYMFGPTVPPRPDLVVKSIAYLPGLVTFSVENVGNGPSAASVVRVQIDGALLIDVNVTALDAGKSIDLTAPTTLAVGTHTLKAIADNEKVVKESNEVNNAKSASTTVDPPPTPPVVPPKTTTAKKGPDAGPLLIGLLLVAALVGRRRYW